MTAHTPGPWRYERDQFTEDEGPVWVVEDVAGHNTILAKIPVDGGDGTHSEQETEANARAIAALPRLLAAALNAERALSDDHGDLNFTHACHECYALNELRSAIAEATGASE